MPYRDPAAQSRYQREWRARRRAEWFAEHGPCVDCGSWERLEVDHVDPATKADHNVWSWSPARRDAELVKCVVRCHDHTRARQTRGASTRGERNSSAKVSEDDVRAIRAAQVTSVADLSRQYGLSDTQVRRIIRRERWRHVA